MLIKNQNEPKPGGLASDHGRDKASKSHPLEMTLHHDSQAHPRREICKFLQAPSTPINRKLIPAV